MKQVAVVVPVYQKSPTKDEMASLVQAEKLLGKYPIILVCPESLDVSEYRFLTDNVERFDDKNFKGVAAYSRLCLDVRFYKRFQDYEYILIYQPDGWVFKDELKYWCEQGYDYIGSPWFEKFDAADENSKLLDYVGNGGMSLRNVSRHIQLFENEIVIHSYKDIADENRKKKPISNLINTPYNFARYLLQYVVPARYITKLNEDFYIAKYAKKIVRDFKIPSPDVAMHFAFENQPKRLYEMTNQTLPFLCHAFKKYDFEFWKQFIKIGDNNG